MGSSVTDPFLTTFYYIEKLNGILCKNRGGRGLKNLTYLGVGAVKNCQNHPYVINEWPLNVSSRLIGPSSRGTTIYLKNNYFRLDNNLQLTTSLTEWSTCLTSNHDIAGSIPGTSAILKVY